MPGYREIDVQVEGGTLHAGLWGDAGPVLLCSHGLTANHRSFEGLARLLADRCRLVAPDHRGRAGSRHITGPWGMKAHAADVVALLDHLAIERADVMVGHSMGAFIAAVTQAEYPERVASVLMIDGGLPLADEVPEGVTPEQLIHAVVGPAMERLDMTFESVEAYYDFWKQHPAVAEGWSRDMEKYLNYELVGEAPHLRAGVNKQAVIGDAESQLMSDDIPEAISRLSVPVRFLRAARGLVNGAPLYPLERLEKTKAQIRDFDYRAVEDINHYTILLSERGAREVARQIEALLALSGL